MNIARFTADLGGLKASPELGRRARKAGRDLEKFARTLPGRLPRDLPRNLSQSLSRNLPRRAPRLGTAGLIAVAAGGILAGVAVGVGVRALLRRRADKRAAASPGPALTTPEEIGADGSAGGPMPDAIRPGDDSSLIRSPAFAGHDDAGLEDMQGVANTLARH